MSSAKYKTGDEFKMSLIIFVIIKGGNCYEEENIYSIDYSRIILYCFQ